MNREARILKALRKRLSQLSTGKCSKAELYVIKQGIEAMEQAIQEQAIHEKAPMEQAIHEKVPMEQVIDVDIYDIYGINQLYEKLFK